MSRILFVWELGANFGHLTRQLPVAERLRMQGHAVFFAVRDTAVAARLLEPHGFAYTQAPFYTACKRPSLPPANYAEILLASGYDDPVTLRGLVRSWLSLIRLTGAEIIVADHAPTAMFTAYLVGLPTLVIGTGFEIPPHCSPMPSIRPWECISDTRLQHAEEQVLIRLNSLTALFGKPKLSCIGELFQKASTMLATFAELDHYGMRVGEIYVGHLCAHQSGQHVTWHELGKPHLFGYLRPSVPGFESLMQALSKQPAEVIVVVPGIRRSQAEALASKSFRVFAQPIALDNRFLSSVDLAISYAGTGTVVSCLLAGIPMLLVPQNVEQYLMSRCVETLGGGLAVKAKCNEMQFTGLLEQALQTPDFRQHAVTFATRYVGFNPLQTIDHAVLRIEALLASS